jgi:lantibiotic transport system permease protein
MYIYLKSEFLKTKRTRIRKIVWIIPIICSLLALSFNSLGGTDIVKLSVETIINHWGIIWVSVFIALTTGLLNHLEKKGTKFKTIIGLPINLAKKELSRILLISSLTATGSLLLIIFLMLTSLLIHSAPYLVPLSSCALAVFLTYIVTLWQVPFCLWLSRKTNIFMTLFVNSMLNLNLGTVFAPTDNWWMIPYSWHLRMLMPLTKLHSNAIPLTPNDELLDDSVISVAILLSIAFFLILTIATVKSFNKIEVK